VGKSGRKHKKKAVRRKLITNDIKETIDITFPNGLRYTRQGPMQTWQFPQSTDSPLAEYLRRTLPLSNEDIDK